MNNEYIDYIDELTHEERSVFFYYFVLKIAPNTIALKLNMKQKRVRFICNSLKQEMDFWKFQQDILLSFEIK